jgi:hypothetical protein
MFLYILASQSNFQKFSFKGNLYLKIITKYIVVLRKHKIVILNYIVLLYSMIVLMNAVKLYSSLSSNKHTCAQSTKTRQNVAKFIIQIFRGVY